MGSPNSLRSRHHVTRKSMQKNDRSIILVDAILAFWSTHLLVVAMELCVHIAAWLPFFWKPLQTGWKCWLMFKEEVHPVHPINYIDIRDSIDKENKTTYKSHKTPGKKALVIPHEVPHHKFPFGDKQHTKVRLNSMALWLRYTLWPMAFGDAKSCGNWGWEWDQE